MSWISPNDLVAVHPSLASEDTDHLQALIDHVQGLAEALIGERTEPVSKRLKSVTVQTVIRFWRASEAMEQSPSGLQSENVDDYGYTFPTGPSFVGSSGLGLTNREKQSFRTAVGRTGLWIQPTTRGPVETAPTNEGRLDEYLDGAY